MSNLSRRSFLRTGLAGGATLAVSTVSTAALAAKPAKGLYIPGSYSAKAAGIGDIVVTMTFDENRNPVKSAAITQIENGEYQFIEFYEK